MTTIQDQRPHSPGRRSRPRAEAVRVAARAAMHTGTGVVVVALAVAAFAGRGTPVAHGAWTTAAGAGAVGVLAGLLRTALGSCRPARRHGDLFGSLLCAVLIWVFAATFAFSWSYFWYARALDRHATLKVTATLSHCVDGGDGNLCTYHWLVDGRAYSSRDAAAQAWPDGHRVTVRIDPAHPGHPAQVTRGYWALWIGVAVGAVGTPAAALAGWANEPDLDRW
ncbi:hypothetical protein E6W39_02390 [Kitasatospora acidiphila]|uniref:DUF3592 domain-containing protein n=1 Tax=Kitasatospora acidiphila TaxID=2567942 RepID=A0A540VX03_9ACTN|nr:hypothetical protein [Kitasatospora acidiphila]TQF01293.1 hypothetical protein E6W39_02390 [Kitasatospora acidiphila]